MRAVLGPAIGKIRFLTLTPAEFAEGPALSPLLSQDESFAILLNISSKTNVKLPPPENFSTSSTPRKSLPEVQGLQELVPENHVVTPGQFVDSRKYYCVREVLHRSHCNNVTILDCYVSFTVDKNVCVLGIQVCPV